MILNVTLHLFSRPYRALGAEEGDSRERDECWVSGVTGSTGRLMDAWPRAQNSLCH